MEKFRKICINCPAGCHLEIEKDGDNIRVSGNTCPRGVKYATLELTDPRRTVTAVIRSAGEKHCCIPVKTTCPVPMAMIPELLKALFAMQVTLPVRSGEVILKNFNGTGADVIATSNCR